MSSNMQPKRKIYSALKIIIPALVFFVSIGFVGKKQEEKLCRKIIVRIENQDGNFFINEGDIMDVVTKNGQEMVVNLPFENVKLKEIEERIEQLKFVQSAQVYRDLSGYMMIDAMQAKPIARIFNPGGKDYYISDRGEIIPVSDRFTARVMVLSGSFFKPYLNKNMLLDDAGRDLFNFIKFIEKDRFWSAQFAQLEVDKRGMIKIYPQVTKQLIEFGNTFEYANKLSKLKIFYDKILPDRGWNRYDRVNLQFKDQIICE
ncbi:cell division protein FtsQ [Marivirga sp. S37H4]|uniref:Cell division protein FtsQ n=1 Tax=Marivirga aurantiaca TaxID=2802615 RepID=A0A934X274_9BACT|nr:cell division protein FtsQ [Marivirga aurantiaca]MBK6266960.1 cell division protein FtsQ [Marivirga aurantiaca]